MSEYQEPLDRALESLLKTLAPGVPGELEVERMAARARQVTTAGARTGWRSWQLATTVATLVVFAGGLALVEGLGGIGHRVPASSTTSSTHAAPSRPSMASTSSAWPHSERMRLNMAGTDDNRPFVNRRAIDDPKRYGHVTPGELGRRLRVDLKLPAKAAGGEFQGIYDRLGKDSEDSFMAVYSNDVVIQIEKCRDPAEAAYLLSSNYLYPDVVPHVTEFDLSGTKAYAVPKLDVAPVLTGETTVETGGITLSKVKTGTGIRTGTAKVFWQRGRFVVEVMNPDQSIEALKGVARSMTFEPWASSTPASSTP